MYDLILAISCFLFCIFTLGLFQKYAPEVLPEFLRRKKEIMKTVQVKVTYLYYGNEHDYIFDMQAADLQGAIKAVESVVQNKKFLPTEDSLIPVVEIKHISFAEVKE
jgi:hypothetical protein